MNIIAIFLFTISNILLNNSYVSTCVFKKTHIIKKNYIKYVVFNSDKNMINVLRTINHYNYKIISNIGEGFSNYASLSEEDKIIIDTLLSLFF